MIPRRFQSPLLGTIIVLAALAVLAVPLRRLTAQGGSPQGTPGAETGTSLSPDTIQATLRVRTIDPLTSIRISDESGHVIYQATDMAPGEIETGVRLAWQDGGIDLTMNAESGGKETAVFLTLLPDAREERSAHAIGSGDFGEILNFHWDHE